MKFGQLILRRIVKIVATNTKCQILRLKCTKIDFGWGSAPRPRWGSLQRSPRPPSWISGGLLLREGRGKDKKEGEERERRDGRGREGGREGREPPERSPSSKFATTPLDTRSVAWELIPLLAI